MTAKTFSPKHASDPVFQKEIETEVIKDILEIESSLTQEMISLGQEVKKPEEWKPARGNDPFETVFDRRTFMRGGTVALSALAMSYPLQELMNRHAYGAPVASPYGKPVPTADMATGLKLIALPPGFRYTSYGWTGDPLSSQYPGVFTPNLHDGMGVIREIGDRSILCRNHETGGGPAFFGGPMRYSAAAAGGNTNLIFNRKTEKFEKAWPSLSGTIRNCAGGVTAHGTWVSCEETFSTTGTGEAARTHGWCFDVPALGVKAAAPIPDMGRFSHEAVAVDPKTGIVYETEDAGASGFYRFIPNVSGNYAAGGVLQMLKVVGVDRANLSGAGRGGPHIPAGSKYDVEWVSIDDPDVSEGVMCADQGLKKGACFFRRLEGCWPGVDRIYFLSTDGGVVNEGTVFCYNILEETLEVLFDSSGFSEVDNPDNMVVTPRGGYILCEDNSGAGTFRLDGINTERLIGLTHDGGTFDFAYNLIDFSATGMGTYTRRGNSRVFNTNDRGQEWAGACYSGDGKWLFACIQTPGVTLAITGPWGAGPL